jgi:hypothetical protein
MDHFNDLLSGYPLAAWFFVGFAAICFGIALAKTLNPSNDDMIRRGDCPACKSRKSLRTTPYSRSSAILTCGDCVAQWLIENTDGEQIVFGPATEPVMPPLRMTVYPDGRVKFETEVGIAIYDVRKFNTSTRWTLQSCETPRHKLNYLYRSGTAPVWVELAPKQAEMADENEVTHYMWFAASAGVDIYHLMPGWTNGLHGTREDNDEHD